jgi:hypothetical protein
MAHLLGSVLDGLALLVCLFVQCLSGWDLRLRDLDVSYYYLLLIRGSNESSTLILT